MIGETLLKKILYICRSRRKLQVRSIRSRQWRLVSPDASSHRSLCYAEEAEPEQEAEISSHVRDEVAPAVHEQFLLHSHHRGFSHEVESVEGATTQGEGLVGEYEFPA